MSIATFGAGCFWGVEAAFRKVEGVIKTEVGYSGGHAESPTYDEVCTDSTGHAEVVRVEFDPNRVSYDELLDVFWTNHDPSQLNRQGPDIGTQYRSVIFFHDDEQENEAVASREKTQECHPGKIVTTIDPAREFHAAEEHHQQYLAKRGQIACASTVRKE